MMLIGFFYKQILSETTNEFRYVDSFVFLRDVTNPSLWNFELGSGESLNLLEGILVGFRERDRQSSQNLNKYIFY